MKKFNFAFVLFMLFLNSCQDKIEPLTPIEKTKAKVAGVSEKGPFTIGSKLDLHELDDNFNQTGKLFSTQIKDDLGNFQFSEFELESPIASFTIDGYFFNENQGKISESRIILQSISDVRNEKVNINLITDLISDRIRKLVKTDGIEFHVAEKQATEELLTLFKINQIEFFADQISIIDKSEMSNILIAISSIIQGSLSVGEFSVLKSQFKSDFQDDGVINDKKILDQIENSTKHLHVYKIKENIEAYYAGLGKNITIGNIENYIDINGNGDLNDETLPELGDISISKIGTFQLNAKSSIISKGNLPILDSGFEIRNLTELNKYKWSTDSTMSNTIPVAGLGPFSIKAYALNAIGYSYSDSVSFLTPSQGIWEKLKDLQNITSASFMFERESKLYSIDLSWNLVEFDPVKETLTTISKFPVSGTNTLIRQGFYFDDKAYFLKDKDIYEFNFNTKAWVKKTSYPEKDIISGPNFCFQIGSKMYFGGGDIYGTGRFNKSFYEYNIKLNQWKKLSDYPFHPVSSPATFAHNGLGYVGLGYSNVYNSDLNIYQGTYTRNFYKYDPSADKWNEIAMFPGIGRFGTISSVIENEKVIVGLGGNGNYLSDMWEYDIKNDFWYQKTSIPGYGRVYTQFCKYNGEIYVIGGSTQVGNQWLQLKEVWKFKP